MKYLKNGIVVDGIALPFAGAKAEAVAEYHRHNGDTVIKRESGGYIEIFTEGGEALSLSEAYANIVTGYPFSHWNLITFRTLKRRFDPSLDLKRYLNFRTHEARVVREDDINAIRWRLFYSSIEISSTEKLELMHIGDCIDEYHNAVHQHRLRVSLKAEIRGLNSDVFSFDLEEFIRTVKSISRFLIVSDPEWHQKEKQSKKDLPKKIMRVPENDLWHKYVAKKIGKWMIFRTRSMRFASVTIYENRSMLAMAVIDGVTQ